MTAPKCCKKGEIKHLGERTAVALEQSCVAFSWLWVLTAAGLGSSPRLGARGDKVG